MNVPADTITCPRCRNPIDTALAGHSGAVRYCPYCGEKLSFSPPDRRDSFCPSCRKALSAPFDYCPSCGVPLTKPAVTESEAYIEPPPSPAELAAGQRTEAPAPGAMTPDRQIVTDPKLKKLYKQWAAYADLPEESLPVMERPKPVPAFRSAATQRSTPAAASPLTSFLASIPPLYVFIVASVIVVLILILIIVIAV